MSNNSLGANKVEPIRDINQIQRMKKHLYDQSDRNGFLFTFGINSGLKITDILPLKVKDVKYSSHLDVNEKTGGIRRIRMTPSLKLEVDEYTKGKDDDQFLFPSREGEKPICRVTAWNILKKAAFEVGIEESIGTSTLRKTFGYHYYMETKDVAMLQQIFGHSSVAVTMKFIDIVVDISEQTLEDFSI
jgi:integrase